MPTKLKNRDDCWLARVVVDGKQIDSKVFPPGRVKGSEWTAAKNWEVQRKKEILAEMATRRTTLTGSALLLAWGERYLKHAERTMSHSTFVEKRTVMQELYAYCREEGITSLEGLTKAMYSQFLADVADERSLNRANVYRKNLLAAWNWAVDGVEGFPQVSSPLARVKPYPVAESQRYVPPEEDVIKVLKLVHGQDLVMLLTYYFTGARRGEVFRLYWSRDIDLRGGKIRLIDHKGRNGRQRVRWAALHPELVKALSWWWDARPCKVDNVFMQTHCDSAMGLPFKHRNHFMPTLCERAGVKPFGFHAMRHKSAEVVFVSKGLNDTQILMGHSRATTTDLYVRSAGLYADKSMIPTALGEHMIGQSAIKLMEMEMPHGLDPREAFCKQEPVNNRLQ